MANNNSTILFTQWNVDSNGNKISVQIQNEIHQVVQNKILLNQIPDEFYHVQINGYVEIKKNQTITSANQYSVNYTNGEIYFHNSKDGSMITIAQYYGRGQVYISDERIVTKYDGTTIVETLDVLTDETNTAKDNAITATNNANSAINTINTTNTNLHVWEDYNPTKPYKVLNKVQYNGNAYVCIAECTGIYPTDITKWKIISRHGEDGLASFDKVTVTIGANNTTHVVHNLNYDPVHDTLWVIDSEFGSELETNIDYTENADNKSIDLINGFVLNIGDKLTFKLGKGMNDATLQETIDDSIVKKGELQTVINDSITKKNDLQTVINTADTTTYATVGNMGDKSNLTTANKTSIVNAINENKGRLDSHDVQLAESTKKIPATSDLKFDGSDTTLRVKEWLEDSFLNDKKLFLPNDVSVDSTYFNKYGTDIQGDGAILLNNKFKMNSPYRNKGYVFGLEYAIGIQNKVRTNYVANDWITTQLKAIFSGDSTTAGDGVESSTFFIDQCFKTIVEQETNYKLTYTNKGHSSKNSTDWINTYLAEDLALNPDLYVIRWGINDGSSYTLGTRLSTYFANLRTGLNTIRTQKSVNQMCIVLMSPSSTNDYLYNRDYKWHDQINSGLREIAREYQCVFIDTYSLFQDSRSGGGWMDTPYVAPNDDIHIHPKGALNWNIAGVIFETLFPIGFTAHHPKVPNTEWISLPLINNWVSGSSPNTPTRYREVVISGKKHYQIEGYISNGDASPNTKFALLPKGAGLTKYYICMASGGTAQIQIDASGGLYFFTNVAGAKVYAFLDLLIPLE